jgi:hypothetical protein
MSDQPQQGAVTGLWAELKRRRVVRVIVLYAIAGWIVIEVTSTVSPNLFSLYLDFSLPSCLPGPLISARVAFTELPVSMMPVQSPRKVPIRRPQSLQRKIEVTIPRP